MTAIYYTEVNLICIIILLLFRLLLSRKTDELSSDKRVFDKLLWVTVIYCISDMISGCCIGQSFPGIRIISEIANLIYFESLTVIAYLWMCYVFIRLNITTELNYKKYFWRLVPLIVFTVFAVSNPFTHFLFYFDEANNYVRSMGVWIHWLTTWAYLILSTGYTAKAIICEKNKLKRSEYVPLLYFVIAPIISCIIQMFFYGVSSSQVGITISIVIIFLETQNNQVLTDSLTGLNNRRAFDTYLQNHTQHHTDASLALLMIDINKFKQVNDKYGHIMGDKALKNTAGALIVACRKMSGNLFLCRFGGDEFIIVMRNKTQQEIESFPQIIHKEISDMMIKEKTPYKLTVSIGVATGTCLDIDDAAHLLRVADEAMYVEKKNVVDSLN